MKLREETHHLGRLLLLDSRSVGDPDYVGMLMSTVVTGSWLDLDLGFD